MIFHAPYPAIKNSKDRYLKDLQHQGTFPRRFSEPFRVVRSQEPRSLGIKNPNNWHCQSDSLFNLDPKRLHFRSRIFGKSATFHCNSPSFGLSGNFGVWVYAKDEFACAVSDYPEIRDTKTANEALQSAPAPAGTTWTTFFTPNSWNASQFRSRRCGMGMGHSRARGVPPAPVAIETSHELITPIETGAFA